MPVGTITYCSDVDTGREPDPDPDIDLYQSFEIDLSAAKQNDPDTEYVLSLEFDVETDFPIDRNRDDDTDPHKIDTDPLYIADICAFIKNNARVHYSWPGRIQSDSFLLLLGSRKRVSYSHGVHNSGASDNHFPVIRIRFNFRVFSCRHGIGISAVIGDPRCIREHQFVVKNAYEAPGVVIGHCADQIAFTNFVGVIHSTSPFVGIDM